MRANFDRMQLASLRPQALRMQLQPYGTARGRRPYPDGEPEPAFYMQL